MTDTLLLPILASAIAGVLIGYIWYHPRVFGAAWMRLAGFTPEMVERAKKRVLIVLIIALLVEMYVAWTLSSIGIAFAVSDWISAIVVLSVSLWLGFVVPVLLGLVLLDQKPIKLFFIHAFYWLVTLSVMSLILLSGGYFTVNAGAGLSTSPDSSGAYVNE